MPTVEYTLYDGLGTFEIEMVDCEEIISIFMNATGVD